MHLPVPFEMIKQVDFKDYRAFLERTVALVEPILKLDRLYPDPIMFRLTNRKIERNHNEHNESRRNDRQLPGCLRQGCH